jgi:hypothetical protein
VFGAKLVLADEEKQPPVGIAVRLVNGLLQHWIYGTGASAYICKSIDSQRDWSFFSVDLTDKHHWRRFESDGNPSGPETANFECICSVIIEIGRLGRERPNAEGTAVIDVGPIVLLDDPDDYPKYLPA